MRIICHAKQFKVGLTIRNFHFLPNLIHRSILIIYWRFIRELDSNIMSLSYDLALNARLHRL